MVNDNHQTQSNTKNVSSVVKFVGESQLPQEFITIGKTFAEALGRCSIRDDEQKNAIIIYQAQLEMFGMLNEINDLTNLLNASSAVGGFNKSLAAMTYTGIFVPEGAGISMSKQNQKALAEIQKHREERQTGWKGNNNEPDNRQ